MSGETDRFETFDFEGAIRARAERSGITLPEPVCRGLAEHARSMLRQNALLHLTTITDPEEVVERHLGEALEGAALLDPEISGKLLDLGSGNGYPGLALAAARPGLTPVLVESSEKKAAFLQDVSRIAGIPDARVLPVRVHRAEDLRLIAPVQVLAVRAVGGWSRVVPKLAPILAPDARVLLWAGADAEKTLLRRAWQRFELLKRHPLPGRTHSWIWMGTFSKT